MSSGKLMLGVLAGVTAGAVAGILFAPAKGSKTRRRILKSGENYSDALKDKFNGLLDVVTRNFEKVKVEVSDYASEMVNNKEGGDPTKTT